MGSVCTAKMCHNLSTGLSYQRGTWVVTGGTTPN